MASMNIDKPLDEIIKSNPRTRDGKLRSERKRTSRGSGPAQGAAAAKGGATTARNQRAAADNRQRPPVVIPGRGSGPLTGSKIILSNLPYDVTEPQVRELMSTSIGPLRKLAMNFRQNGTSTGVCTVEFQRADDAQRAYQQFNNRLIDGKKSLRVEVVVDPAKVPVQVAPRAAQQPRRNAAPAASAPAARGGAAGGRGRRGGRSQRPAKTMEDLDAEMEDYAKSGAAEPAAAEPATTA